jgi:FAD/FMN-containing dehydrogenase
MRPAYVLAAILLALAPAVALAQEAPLPPASIAPDGGDAPVGQESLSRDAELDQLFASRYPGWEICLFGHIGDGNLHVNVMKPDAMDRAAFFAKTKALDPAMFELVRRHRGSISAEHGIGLLKKPYLGYTRSPAEIEVMRSVKRALDPKGIMNPGKVFDA